MIEAGDGLVILRLKSLLALVNVCIAESDRQIAQQTERVAALKANGQSSLDEEKTLDVMIAVAASLKDSHAMLQMQIAGLTLH
jgi:hypothetical protein